LPRARCWRRGSGPARAEWPVSSERRERGSQMGQVDVHRCDRVCRGARSRRASVVSIEATARTAALKRVPRRATTPRRTRRWSRRPMSDDPDLLVQRPRARDPARAPAGTWRSARPPSRSAASLAEGSIAKRVARWGPPRRCARTAGHAASAGRAPEALVSPLVSSGVAPSSVRET
jgi:hypothetical protein